MHTRSSSRNEAAAGLVTRATTSLPRRYDRQGISTADGWNPVSSDGAKPTSHAVGRGEFCRTLTLLANPTTLRRSVPGHWPGAAVPSSEQISGVTALALPSSSVVPLCDETRLSAKILTAPAIPTRARQRLGPQ
jgi:hypothetical protein